VFLTRLIFDSKDVGDMFLRCVGSYTDYTGYIPEDGNIHFQTLFPQAQEPVTELEVFRPVLISDHAVFFSFLVLQPFL
jgi:hypothetical protein